MKYQSSRAVRSAATAIALAAAAGAVTSSHSANAQSQPPAVQWRVEDGGNGHWYQFVPYGVLETWHQAVSYAATQGGHLATIRSSGEQTFAYQLTASGSCEPAGTIWLGADQPSGSAPNVGWRWTSGEPWGYTNWSSGEPNDFQGWQEDCLVMLHPGGSWYDIRKDGFASPSCTRAALIEWSADCNGDGIVDYGQCRDGSLPDYNGDNVPDCCETDVACTVGRYPVQWRANDGGNGHWYQVRDRVPEFDWNDWRLEAESMGAHLVTITSSAENEFVSSRHVWGSSDPSCVGGHALIGLFQPAGSYEPSVGWQWVTGESFVFNANQWGSLEDCCEGNPYCGGDGEDAAAIWSWAGDCEEGAALAGKWNDVGKCLDWWGAVFEWDADCNGDGIVDYGQILRGQLADANGDGIPNVCQCPGDVTANNTVDGVDLAALLSAWGSNGQGQFMTDIDGDGIVSGADLAYVLSGWGPCPE
jgi:hypothetical protein